MPVREAVSYDFDDFRLDVKRQQLLKNGEPVALTYKAFQILLILVQNFEQTVEKENIYQQLWGDSFVEDANLTQHIYVLRKTLGQNASGESYIETVARLGYRFKADVRANYAPSIVPLPELQSRSTLAFGERSAAAAARTALARQTHLRLAENGSAPEQELIEDNPGEQPSQPEIRRSFWNRKGLLAALAGAVAAALILGLIYFVRRTPSSPPNAVAAKSLAVLPFKPIGEESQNQKLGLGMADAIITRLSKVKQIPVRPTSSVIRYTDQPTPSSVSAGNELGVDTVLEGTVQRDNNRIRVSVQLLNVADGKTLWAENFDENFNNIFSVQDSISAKVVYALEINLAQRETELLRQHSTSSPEAYEAYQMGLYFENKRSKEGLQKAISYFQKAVDLDPQYAEAYAMLADSTYLMGYYNFEDPAITVPKARKAAETALRLNDQVAEAYIALAALPMPRPPAGNPKKELLERAIELSPYNPTAHVRYGWVLLNLNPDDLDSPLRQMRLAQEYDPLSGFTNGALCQILIFKNELDDAVKVCERAVELSAEAATNRQSLADAYFLAGRSNDAIAEIDKRIDESGGIDKLSAIGSLGYYYAKMGRRKEAENILNQLDSVSEQYPTLLNDLILISFALNKRDEGIRYFQQAYQKRALYILMLRQHPFWAEVRNDPEIDNLLKERSSSASPQP